MQTGLEIDRKFSFSEMFVCSDEEKSPARNVKNVLLDESKNSDGLGNQAKKKME